MNLITERGSTKSVCPSEVARRLAPHNWRSEMNSVHQTVKQLRAIGELVISQKGEVITSDDIVGPYRIRLPRN